MLKVELSAVKPQRECLLNNTEKANISAYDPFFLLLLKLFIFVIIEIH